MFKTKVTSQGTVSLPAPLRKKYKLRAGDVLSIEDNGAIVIQKVPDLKTMRTKNASFIQKKKIYKSGDGFEAHIVEKYGHTK